MRSFKKIRRLPVLLLIFFLPLHQKAQKPAVPDLIFPWTGGLNSAQFCSIDLNLDGISDLVVFDRHGNRIIPFINENPVPGEMNYAYAPQYISAFPDLHDWVQMIDYDQDGRMDLFTCGEGGARVFRNSPDSVLKFQLVTDLLSSFYYTGKVGILITTADYPAFTDVDHDGDLDLLTFFGLGAFVEYHRNLSMEKYGIPDSLDLRLEDKCWGDFREGLESNILDLNVVCPYKKSFNMTCTGERHTGSTLLATDLNHDGLTDLILGDIDYPQLITLINGGTIDSAHMISQDTIFPFSSHPVRLFSFPACSFLDMDNDGLRDII
ncbi:MAG: FG-GAP repeat domain-containing protein, partial [Syntrophothermus sp.]